MIQAIKIPVIIDGDEKELSFEYDELEDCVCIMLDNKFVCTGCYKENFKEAFKKILDKWK